MGRTARGFTLIEVLVALVIMATMAVMSWRGIDALLKSRDIAQTHLDQTVRLQTVLAQWEQDLRALQDSHVAAPLSFDGGSLRITRSQPLGMQVVAWTVRSGRLYRWEGPTVQTVAALQESIQRSQQLLTQENVQLKALEGVSGWQLFYYRGNGWSNALSSEKVEKVVYPPRIPTVRNALNSGDRCSLRALNSTIAPMMRPPVMFTTMMPSGKHIVGCWIRPAMK